jgi:hypothetical protein
MPFGDNSRYDMIVDDGQRLCRVQVKTARDGPSAGTVAFNTASIHPISGKKTRYDGQIEAFIAYHPGTSAFFWVPISECSGDRLILRTAPAKNNQVYGTRPADPFHLQHARSVDRATNRS